MADPVSWYEIEQGWIVLTTDGAPVGHVSEVTGDEAADIFDGLMVQPEGSGPPLYIPAERVSAIVPGLVRLDPPSL